MTASASAGSKLKPFLKFVGLCAAVLLLSCLLAPLLHSFLPFKFERIFRRLVMIFTLAAVFFAVKSRRLYFPASTLAWSRSSLIFLALGFSGGLLTLVLLAAAKAGLGIVGWNVTDMSAGQWAFRIFLSFFSALLIGVLEEVFFRGLVFGSLREKLHWPLGLTLAATNFFYAVVHFLSGKKPYIGASPDFFDALKLVLAPVKDFMHWQDILPGAIGLFIFGIILNLLLLRTGTLYASIGLHAGCVFFLKMAGALTSHQDKMLFYFGSGKGYDGVLGWIFLAVMGVALLGITGRLKKTGLALILAAVFAFACRTGHPAWCVEDEGWTTFSSDKDTSLDSTDSTGGEPAPEALPSVAPSAPKRKVVYAVDSAEETAASEVPTVPTAAVSTPRKTLPKPKPKIPVTPRPAAAETQDTEVAQAFVPEPASTPAPKTVEKKMPRAEIPLPEEPAPAPHPVKRITAPAAAEPAAPQKKISRKPAAESKAAVPLPQVPSGGGELPYDISGHLPEAQVSTIEDQVVVTPAAWKENGFYFEKEEGDAAVALREESYNGQNQKGIFVEPVQNGIRRIRFPHVPPARTLVVQYGIADAGFEQNVKSAIYLRIWAGHHLLKRIRVLNEKGWKNEPIDLGVIAFLKKPVVLTFDVTADDATQRHFSFYAEMK
ncbi:MAG TPA: CPBP family glutamic-type intramembrane protease [Verrucomicrobiae bacterium]|jgi:membrane protease YdiL (CAAX protease family)|nr:CPBP family glutamic-type intramembrane protease [Verrucomicrobiae bacterium]